MSDGGVRIVQTMRAADGEVYVNALELLDVCESGARTAYEKGDPRYGDAAHEIAAMLRRWIRNGEDADGA